MATTPTSPGSSRIYPELSADDEERIRSEARRLCKQDLHYLAKEVLGYRRLTDHYHRAMAQDIDTPRYRFRLLLHGRGHFKSTLATESFSIQSLLRDPNQRILISNAKLDNSRKFLRAIAHHFGSNAKFRWVWRDWWLQQHANPFHRQEMGEKLDWVVRDTLDEFTLLRPYTGREGSITTGAIDASQVSQHYSTIIADDLINREYVRSLEMVEKSILYFKDLLDLLDPDGQLVLIGTRWSHQDLYHWIIQEFGGSAYFRVLPGFVAQDLLDAAAAVPDQDKDWMVSMQPATIDGTMDGPPVFPEEFTPKVLANLLKAKGPYEFGAQYLLNPTPRANQKFQPEWFRKLDILPQELLSDCRVCITVDPAHSISDQADHTAFFIAAYDSYNNMYFIDGIDEHLTEDELLDTLFDKVRYWQEKARFVLPVGFEALGFQETYINNLERMMKERNFFFAVEPITRRTHSKQERILRLVPRLKNGFYMLRHMPRIPKRGQPYDLAMRFEMYLTKFPFMERDDLPDAAADQQDIVLANSFPSEREHAVKKSEREFVHPSILEDRRKGARALRYISNDAVR